MKKQLTGATAFEETRTKVGDYAVQRERNDERSHAVLSSERRKGQNVGPGPGNKHYRVWSVLYMSIVSLRPYSDSEYVETDVANQYPSEACAPRLKKSTACHERQCHACLSLLPDCQETVLISMEAQYS